ncbi:Smc5-6 complex non-SMC subunit Nse4 [Schizosaccharomyces japonicus yFS275]|uniref:Non-structural maintenance of chromosomes element 4 n=1 Tax=Schizosaccharomyces japonicus (strain yFS275 / FY16936) TaxID=402676 RepID=B6K0D9_SCHJY|nr:Smc5-6 complex non-SMC subunit Nse4 [Schizosaccharomyces japonicus yFS275]EEB06289.1 Smc5-6 complex non-SMC subunit Nse4 [Schizosaccharomyces japonicus yFS275]
MDQRQIRKSYRSLIKRVQDSRLQLIEQENDGLQETVLAANRLFASVQAPNEASLDAILLTRTVDLASLKTKQLKIGKTKFKIENYVRQLKRALNVNEGAALESYVRNADVLDSWAKLGEMAWKCQKRACPVEFMTGPLSFRRKERQIARRTRQQRVVTSLTKPIKLKESDLSTQKQETPGIVMQIAKILKEYEPVSLFKFITNPENFSQTVENLFCVSHLVKEGKVGIREDENGLPILETRIPPSDETLSSGKVKNIQLVLNLDMAIYEDIIETFHIKKSLIPTRPPPKELEENSTSWYG